MSRAQEIADLLSGVTITTADNDPQLTLTSTDTDAGHGPRLNMVRNPGEAGADTYDDGTYLVPCVLMAC